MFVANVADRAGQRQKIRSRIRRRPSFRHRGERLAFGRLRRRRLRSLLSRPTPFRPPRSDVSKSRFFDDLGSGFPRKRLVDRSRAFLTWTYSPAVPGPPSERVVVPLLASVCADYPPACAGLDFVGAPLWIRQFDPKTSPFGPGPASPILSRFLGERRQDPWAGHVLRSPGADRAEPLNYAVRLIAFGQQFFCVENMY
jgi:hypothetical protein